MIGLYHTLYGLVAGFRPSSEITITGRNLAVVPNVSSCFPSPHLKASHPHTSRRQQIKFQKHNVLFLNTRLCIEIRSQVNSELQAKHEQTNKQLGEKR